MKEDLCVSLLELANEWEGACEKQGPHDICEFCEVSTMIVRAVDEIEKLRAVVNAAKDLFPPKALMWKSPRMDRVRRALAAVGEDPAPTIPFFKRDDELPTFEDVRGILG